MYSSTGNEVSRLTLERMNSRGQYHSQEADNLLRRIEAETGDMTLRQCTHFSAGVVNRIERQMKLGMTIVTDTNLILAGLDRRAASQLNVSMECFIDSPMVLSGAMQKHITRAELAVERAMTLSGPKLIVVGSAPMALNRLLQMHEQTPLQEVTIIAAANGFASVVELKEKLWDSGLNCIVVRGRKGGAPVAIAITNALLSEAAERRKGTQE